jgi:leucyl-tRNA synthetase
MKYPVKMTTYNPQEIEQEAQEFWQREQSFKAVEDLCKEKYYCLAMFPYPSGSLHMGHVRNYTLGDAMSRYQRVLGKNVLQPIGWDAFGLPAENAALKRGLHPAKWTYDNIDAMRAQLKQLGNAYDWSREFATCSPDYYRWEQWLFIQMFKKGLAYKKNTMVNWDPVDNTVLANEQVVDGRGWRSGALIERREISQWFLKITDYAEELLSDLDNLPHWPDAVKQMQRNWIGRSEGLEITFDIQNAKAISAYIGIASEHPLSLKAAKNNPTLKAFIDECKKIKMAEAEIATIEKKGIDTGLKAIHPITGELLPVWAANFILADYGSGAVMCVPAHDQRDFEFAQLYGLAIKAVLESDEHDYTKSAFVEKMPLINSGAFDGLNFQSAFDAIAEQLDNKAQRKVHYRLRDWGISRQRYWGTPIPMISCKKCGFVPVPEEQLPVILPEELPFDGPVSPLKQSKAFLETTCPECGKLAERETDTFDTFMESSWYFARFACPNQEKVMLDDRARYWTAVDQYIGGIEHAVMHLLYARFIYKILRDEGLLNSNEPFKRLLTQGMVLKDGSKMSKSKGNTVDPNALIERYGADTVRFFILFAAPPEQSLEWSDNGVEGAHRFFKKLWQFAHQSTFIHELNDVLDENERYSSQFDWEEAPLNMKQLRKEYHEIISQALHDYEKSQFNTVASACMKLLNAMTKTPAEDDFGKNLILEGMGALLRILAPVSPHITHHLWRELGYGSNILKAPWSKVAKEALRLDKVEYIIQVNGKLRAHATVSFDDDEQMVIEAALAQPNIQKLLETGKIKKTIVLPERRLINLVIG